MTDDEIKKLGALRDRSRIDEERVGGFYTMEIADTFQAVLLERDRLRREIQIAAVDSEGDWEAAKKARAERDAALDEIARVRGSLTVMHLALQRILDTDTHGKNVRDEHGSLRPTGQDFCGRCNRNSFHPHAADCPIEALRAVLDGSSGARAAELIELARKVKCFNLSDRDDGETHHWVCGAFNTKEEPCLGCRIRTAVAALEEDAS